MTEWIISSTVLTGAVLLIRALGKGKLEPKVRYALWAIVLVRLLYPGSLFQTGLSIHNLRQEIVLVQETVPPTPEQSPGAVDWQPVVPGEIQEVPLVEQIPGPGSSEVEAEDPGTHWPEATLPQSQPVWEATAPVQPEPTAHEPMEWPDPAEAARGIWILGVGLMGLWMLGSNLVFLRKLRRSRTALETAGCPLPVYVTGAVESPCLYGLIRPAVYLTPQTARDQATMDYVLAHEVSHYRQGDHVWALLRGVALVLHWYNPLVWAAFRASRQDGEMSCDARTLETLGEEHRAEYGRMLVRLSDGNMLHGTMIAATSLADGKTAMKERIVTLMKHPKNTFRAMMALGLACAILVGCTFTGALESQPGETQPPETTEPAGSTAPEELSSQTNWAERQGPDGQTYGQLLADSGEGVNWIHEAMNTLYDNADQIDHYFLFYNKGWTEREWEELDADMAQYLMRNSSLNVNGPVRVLPAAVVDEVLSKWFGQITPWIIPNNRWYGGADNYYFNGGSYSIEREYYDDTYKAHVADDHIGAHNVTIRNVTEEPWYAGTLISISYTVGPDSHLVGGYGWEGWEPRHLERVLTLYYTQDRGYQILANQLDELERTDPKENSFLWDTGDLTMEQVNGINEQLRALEYMVNGNEVRINSVYRFFSHYYDCPEQIDLGTFLQYFGTPGLGMEYDNSVSDGERQGLQTLEYWPFPDGYTGGSIQKIPAWVVDEVLYQYTGVHLSGVEGAGQSVQEPKLLLYSEKYDAYYTFNSDADGLYMSCVGGRYTEDGLELYFGSSAAPETTMTFKKGADGEYKIYSYQPFGSEHWSNVGGDQTLKSAMVSLNGLLNGTDILSRTEGDVITLTQDGMEIELRTDSKYIRRRGRYMGAMQAAPQMIAGMVYVHKSFYEDFLLANGGTEPSLFNGVYFFRDEVRDALDDPNPRFHQQLLAQVQKPVSMNIDSVNLDPGRVFSETLLTEFDPIFRNTLTDRGFVHVEELTYTEYKVLSGEYLTARKQSEKTRSEYLAGISQERRDFLEEKGILLEDEGYLFQWFYGQYMDKSDAELREALEKSYTTQDWLGDGAPIGPGPYAEPQVTGEPEPGPRTAQEHGIPIPGDLTQDQIDQANETLNSPELRPFFASHYQTPEKINLELFLRNFPVEEVFQGWDSLDVTREELVHIARMKDSPLSMGQVNEGSYQFRRITAAMLDEVVFRHTGVHLRDLDEIKNTGKVRFSDKYRSYYCFAQEEAQAGFQCVGGHILEDQVWLFSNEAVLVLNVQEDGTYRIQTHMPLKWVEWKIQGSKI